MNDLQANIAANKLAQQRLAVITATLSADAKRGFQSVVLDFCDPKPGKVNVAHPIEITIANVVAQAETLHSRHENDWRWENYYRTFSLACGVEVDDDKVAADRFGSAIREVIKDPDYNLNALRKWKVPIVEAMLRYLLPRRNLLNTPEALEGATRADDWILEMEADFVGKESRFRVKFWEKAANTVAEWTT